MNINVYKNELTISDTEVSGYKYIHVIQLNTVTGPGTQYVKYTHNSSTTVLASDGYYTLTQMRLPTTAVPGTYYIVEGPEGGADQVIAPNGSVISINDLLLVDPIGTTITKTIEYWFSYYALHTYYVNLIKAKFLKNVCNCDCISPTDRLTIDSLTMGLTLIKELTTYAQYNEAQRIVEQLNKCTGIVTTSCNCNG